MAFPTGWTKKIALTIDRTKVGSGGVSNFSVLLTRASFGTNGNAMFYGAAAAQADGGDIRFSSDSAGATQLACDVIAFGLDSSSGAADSTCQIRVKVPTVASASDTTIYCWFNAGGGQTQPTASDTYGQHNTYNGVALFYPLEGNATDRSANANNGTLMNSPTATAGKVGQALTFNASSQYIVSGSNGPSGTGAISYGAWIIIGSDVSASNHHVFNIGTAVSTNMSHMIVQTNKIKYGAWGFDNVSTNTYADGNWHHVMVVYTGALYRLYVDGVNVNSSAAYSSPNIAAAARFILAAVSIQL
jgi:hypothetical protein